MGAAADQLGPDLLHQPLAYLRGLTAAAEHQLLRLRGLRTPTARLKRAAPNSRRATRLRASCSPSLWGTLDLPHNALTMPRILFLRNIGRSKDRKVAILLGCALAVWEDSGPPSARMATKVAAAPSRR